MENSVKVGLEHWVDISQSGTRYLDAQKLC